MADQPSLFPDPPVAPAPALAPVAQCSVVGVRVEPCVMLAAVLATEGAIQWGRIERLSDAADRESVVFRGRARGGWAEFKFCPFCGRPIVAAFTLPKVQPAEERGAL